MAEPGASVTEPKNRSKSAGVMARVTTPRNSPFGPVTLQANTVAQPRWKRPCTSWTLNRSKGEPDLNALKKLRSAIRTLGTGQYSDELINAPLESKTLTPATSV